MGSYERWLYKIMKKCKIENWAGLGMWMFRCKNEADVEKNFGGK